MVGTMVGRMVALTTHEKVGWRAVRLAGEMVVWKVD
jgi:hypothetical protein